MECQIADIKEKLNNKLSEEQLRYNKEIEEYQLKYKVLLEELKQTKPITKAKKD